MSRCFPFPPPGYEKKTIAQDFDLLQKEKHRDKKPKKEKRDKEKREGKEKREKDRSDEKHREKKEKKEKHRDKKKDKEKSEDTDTSNHEEKLFGQAHAYKGDTNNEKIKHREKEKSTVASEKVLEHSAARNGMVVDRNVHLMQENKNHRRLHELGSKNPIDEEKIKNLPGGMEIRNDVGIRKMSIRSPVAPMSSSERSMERKINGMTDRHALGAEAWLSDSVHAQKDAGMVQYRAEGTSRSVEKNTDRGSELKIKMKGDQIKNVDKEAMVLDKNVHLIQENKNHKRLHELGSINPIEEGKRNNLPSRMEIRKDVEILKMSIRSPVAPVSSSERSMERKANGMTDRHALGAEAWLSDSVHPQKFAGMVQYRAEGTSRPVEKNTDRGSELKIKMKGKEENDRKGDQIKNVDKEATVLDKNLHLMQENKNHKRLHELGSNNPIEEGKRNKLPSRMEIRKDVAILKMSIRSPVAPMSSSERSMERKINGMTDRHALGAEASLSDSVHAQKFPGMVQYRAEGTSRSDEKNTDCGSELKIKMKGKEGNDRKGDQIKNVDKEETVQKYRERKVNGIVDRLALGAEARPSESVHSQRFAGVVQNRAVQSARPVEKNAELKIKMKGKEGNDRKGDQIKNEDMEDTVRKYKEKDKDSVGQTLVVEQSRVKDSAKLGVNKNGISIVQSARLEKPPNERNKIAPGPENSRKRKEFSPNGVLHEDDVGPKKMARIMSASLPLTQNGRSLQPSQDSAIPALDRQQQALSNTKLDGKDPRIMNGIINPPKASKKPSSEPVNKPPHPDTKYLSSVLSVPKIEDCSAFEDDQEWLFNNKRSNPDSETSGLRTTPQVWAEALRIESADILALPFVIPY